ncbi:trypsin-like serine peptidase [Aliiroseovarius sp. YM-037]|uniref:trypsin-like serine peptidase n=1 Tax=Aliiroseovarius sp. YM-037 TaxID=3341728 RepID=UPI003A7F8BCD
MTQPGVDFISRWTNDKAYSQLRGSRSVHNAERMMRGWSEAQGFEAAVGKKNMVDASLLEILATYRRAVCKITCSGVDFRGLENRWTGTGFLVGPNLLVTNNHVLNSEAVTASAVVDFEHERDLGSLLSQKAIGRTPKRSLQLDPSRLFLTDPAVGGLDFTFAWIGEEAAQDYGFIPMSRASFAGRVYDPVFVIHHPNGDFKKVSLDDTELLNVEVDLLLYAADTEGGSSGAPVITRNGKLCGLHHAFRDDQDLIEKHSNRATILQDGTPYRVANEGIQFSAIAVHLERELTQAAANEANLREVLRHFVDTDTVTGPYGALGRNFSPDSPTGVDNTIGPQETEIGRRKVIEAVHATNQDIDVSVWNMNWLNQHKDDGDALRRAAQVFADITQDLWVLDGISRETGYRLRDELEDIFAQEFGFVFADDESHPELPMTAIFYNTRALNVIRDPWPAHVEDLWRVRAQEDIGLKTISGPVFPSFPARFDIEVPGHEPHFSLRLVPFFLGEHRNIQMRKIVAASIMGFIIEEMVKRPDIDGDWLIAGDVNAPMRSARAATFEKAGFRPLFFRDTERGGFSYLRNSGTILSQIFVPEGTELMGSDDGAVTTVPQVFRDRYVDDLTNKAPYGIRISLMNETAVKDRELIQRFLDSKRLSSSDSHEREIVGSTWRWRT